MSNHDDDADMGDVDDVIADREPDTREAVTHQHQPAEASSVLPKIKFSIDNILRGVAPAASSDASAADSVIHSYYSAQLLDGSANGNTTLDISVDDDDDDDDDVDVNDGENSDVSMKPSDVTETMDEGERYSWLQCTRYKPPKLPRE